jgi:hypothetical protein
MTQNFQGVYTREVEIRQSSWSGVKILNVVLLALIVTGSLYYVTGINDLVVKGFKLQELKSEAGFLAEANKKANVETAKLKAYGNLAKKIESLQMVAVDNVDYLKADSGVALAR